MRRPYEPPNGPLHTSNKTANNGLADFCQPGVALINHQISTLALWYCDAASVNHQCVTLGLFLLLETRHLRNERSQTYRSPALLKLWGLISKFKANLGGNNRFAPEDQCHYNTIQKFNLIFIFGNHQPLTNMLGFWLAIS